MVRVYSNMRLDRLAAIACLLVGAFSLQGSGESFAMFPQAGRLVSPDRRLEVRDALRAGAAAEFVGVGHSLWLTELATGRSRKLCDYLGLAAVAWSSNDFVIVTQYVGRKTSRALVFSVAGAEESVMLDTPALIQLVPVELRPSLRENDHSFVEASRMEGRNFYFRVWGYGKHDPDGFRWDCQDLLGEGKVSCTALNKASVRR